MHAQFQIATLPGVAQAAQGPRREGLRGGRRTAVGGGDPAALGAGETVAADRTAGRHAPGGGARGAARTPTEGRRSAPGLRMTQTNGGRRRDVHT